MGRIDDIICDDITREYLHLASVVGMDDLTYGDLNPDCVKLMDGLTI